MGTELNGTATSGASILQVPWLEPSANRFLHRYILAAAAACTDVEAVILFGSAARQDMRPLTDTTPSDLDVLFLVTTTKGYITDEQRLAIARAEVEAYPDVFDDSLRPIQTVIADPSFTGWDTSFVEGLTRDGLLLWSRRPLPTILEIISTRNHLINGW